MYCITGPARHFQFLCYTISGGGHFPPKINDDCLPWLLSPSLFYALSDQHMSVLHQRFTKRYARHIQYVETLLLCTV